MNIYIGNLNWSTTEDDLRSLFLQFGEVASANIVSDKFTGRSKGFGFIEMPDQTAGQNAINALNGQSFKDRNITVNELVLAKKDPLEAVVVNAGLLTIEDNCSTLNKKSRISPAFFLIFISDFLLLGRRHIINLLIVSQFIALNPNR